jgi:hypothetical protein
VVERELAAIIVAVCLSTKRHCQNIALPSCPMKRPLGDENSVKEFYFAMGRLNTRWKRNQC